MNITLYKTISENKNMNKTLTSSRALTGTLRNETSIINPVIILEVNPIEYNYLYISDFNRYYYINDVRQIRTNVWEIDCKVDVLMSFRSQILQCKANVTRTQTGGNSDLRSDIHVSTAKILKRRLNFPNALSPNNMDIVMITIGSRNISDDNIE